MTRDYEYKDDRPKNLIWQEVIEKLQSLYGLTQDDATTKLEAWNERHRRFFDSDNPVCFTTSSLARDVYNGDDRLNKDDYISDIIEMMTVLFGITLEEATGRFEKWASIRPPITNGDRELIFHELPDYWANVIYYGDEALFWKKEEDLIPVLYP